MDATIMRSFRMIYCDVSFCRHMQGTLDWQRSVICVTWQGGKVARLRHFRIHYFSCFIFRFWLTSVSTIMTIFKAMQWCSIYGKETFVQSSELNAAVRSLMSSLNRKSITFIIKKHYLLAPYIVSFRTSGSTRA